MMMLPRGYDAWRLEGPPESDAVGIEDGQPCNRWSEPDEDCPKPWKCSGVMAETDGGFIACDTCGQMVSGD